MKAYSEFWALINKLQSHLTKIGGNLIHQEWDALVDEVAKLMQTAHQLREKAWLEQHPSGERG